MAKYYKNLKAKRKQMIPDLSDVSQAMVLHGANNNRSRPKILGDHVEERVNSSIDIGEKGTIHRPKIQESCLVWVNTQRLGNETTFFLGVFFNYNGKKLKVSQKCVRFQAFPIFVSKRHILKNLTLKKILKIEAPGSSWVLPNFQSISCKMNYAMSHFPSLR